MDFLLYDYINKLFTTFDLYWSTYRSVLLLQHEYIFTMLLIFLVLMSEDPYLTRSVPPVL